MGVSVAADVLFPFGTFGDVYNTGFGADAQFLYEVDRGMITGIMTGFYTWSGKTDLVANLTGIPLRGLLKYKFSKMFYIDAEAGVFFSWTTDITLPVSGTKVPGTSSADFNYSFGFGFEYPLSNDGDVSLDTAVRYEGASMSGTASNNIALRVGVLFGIGK
jgi:hypothetical protein